MIVEMLNKAIEERGIKQKFIADAVGVSETALSMMLKGKQKMDVNTFFAITQVMRMTPDEIMALKKGA